MKNKMSDLRNHLFETLEALKDTDKPMEIERAKAIANVANSVIESAKVQLKYVELVGGRDGQGGEFFDEQHLPVVPQLTGNGRR